jgi:SsrA-binding protein
LLLSKRQIKQLREATQQEGLTLVPLRVYFKGRVAKVEVGVGRGKKLYDKRATVAKRESDLRLRQEMHRRR